MFTRDSLMLWLALGGAIVAYLISIGTPPTQWDYSQWLQAIFAGMGMALAKLQNSPLPSTREVKSGEREAVGPGGPTVNGSVPKQPDGNGTTGE